MQYTFGAYKISSTISFYQSKLCYAFVNKWPIVPGHILVSPFRVAKRVCDLTDEEVAEMFVIAKKIGPKLENYYGCTSLNFSIQDGKEAGQSVEHVHLHILPRKIGDFSKDNDVHEKLQTHDKGNTEGRTLQEMEKEAAELRSLFIE